MLITEVTVDVIDSPSLYTNDDIELIIDPADINEEATAAIFCPNDAVCVAVS
jgi:hypothetical protein